MKKLVIMAMMMVSAFAFAGTIDTLKIYTEDYPPYNFEKNGAATGISTDILDEVLKEAGAKLTKKDIKVIPWARGYSMVQEGPDVMLFSMTQTPAREKLFKFVGPLIDTDNVLIAKKEKNIKISSPKDIAKYSVGTVRDDIAETALIETGYPKDKIQLVAEPDLNAKKLDAGRIDMWAYGETTALYVLKQNGIDTSKYETVYVLSSGYMSFALSKDVSDDVVKKLQTALDKVKKSPKYKEIIARYIK